MDSAVRCPRGQRKPVVGCLMALTTTQPALAELPATADPRRQVGHPEADFDIDSQGRLGEENLDGCAG